MTHPTADVVICGAGIAGIATAYHLAVKRGLNVEQSIIPLPRICHEPDVFKGYCSVPG